MSGPENPGRRTPMADDVPITELIRRAQAGDAAALRLVFEATSAHSRQMARGRLRLGEQGTWLVTASLVWR